MIFCLSACGTKSVNVTENIFEKPLSELIIGEWHLTEESKDVSQWNYPEVSVLKFSDDGTWNDKSTNTYMIAENTIVMDGSNFVFQYTYQISIENDILMLLYPGDEPLYFEKVN